MRRYVWVLLAYLVLSLLLTWPLAAHFVTHVPGDGIDDPALAWNLWWAKHALVDQPQNPFAVSWQFWPVGINLAFYTLTLLNGALSVPLQAVFGLIPAYNVLLLSSFVLGGFGAYLLGLEFLGRGDKETSRRGNGETGKPGNKENALTSLSAFLGGALYAFASAKLFYAALGQGNIASSQWAPFAALYIMRAARPTGRPHDAALAALFIVLQAYAELTYASFLLIFAALVVAWQLGAILLRWRGPAAHETADRSDYNRSTPPGTTEAVTTNGALSVTAARLILRMVLMAVIFLIGIAPILANMLPDLRAEGDFLTSGGGFADIFSADLVGYLLPTQLHPVLGGIVKAWSQAAAQSGAAFAVDKGQQIYMGYAALTLALLGWWRGRRRGETWFWAVATAFFFLLTLGPSLRIAGHDTGILLPFRLIAALPFFKGNRYPSRYSVMLLLSLAPLVALGMRGLGAAATRRIHERAHHTSAWGIPVTRLLAPLFPCFLALLLLFEHLSAPLPLSDLRVPALYAQIAVEPGDFAVLELPPGWRNGARVAGKQDIVIMQELWNQTAHGKRVLGGNTSRNPEFKFQYFSEDPILARLIALTNAADLGDQHRALRAALAAQPVTEADRVQARTWAAFLSVRYVMVHRDKLPAETEAALRELLPVALVGEEGPLALYRVAEALPQPTAFQPATDQGRMILAEGWSPPPSAVVERAPDPAPVYAQRREAHLLLPLPQAAAQVKLRLLAFAAGQQVTLSVDGRTVAALPVPQEPTWLSFDVPADATRPPLSDVRLRFSQLTALSEVAQRLSRPGPAALLVRSAGQETGDFGHVYLDGIELSADQRGYNLVALTPEGGLLAAANFDTHADPQASARLAQWIGTLPAGTLVAGAVRDEAAMNLGQEAINALRAVGVSADLRGHFRWGHAFIGQVGGPVGSAVEALDAIRPAQVSFGLPLSAPQIALGLFEVQIDYK